MVALSDSGDSEVGAGVAGWSVLLSDSWQLSTDARAETPEPGTSERTPLSRCCSSIIFFKYLPWASMRSCSCLCTCILYFKNIVGQTSEQSHKSIARSILMIEAKTITSGCSLSPYCHCTKSGWLYNESKHNRVDLRITDVIICSSVLVNVPVLNFRCTKKQEKVSQCCFTGAMITTTFNTASPNNDHGS